MQYIRPELSYTIWFSQRTGSTLLCRALQSLGIAGKPSEWLYPKATSDLLDGYQLNSYVELQQKLWQLGTTPNGVFGIKTGACEPYLSKIINTFKQFPGCEPQFNRVEVWHNALLGARSLAPFVALKETPSDNAGSHRFPNCKHIYMTRRNKVRLAVSWWKAIQSQEWHCERGKLPIAADLKDKYSYEAIAHLFAECSMREAAIQEFFNEGAIIPLTIVYEDFILSYETTLRNILDYLGLPNAQNISIPLPPLQQLSDDLSEEWVQRFRSERQQGWINFW